MSGRCQSRYIRKQCTKQEGHATAHVNELGEYWETRDQDSDCAAPPPVAPAISIHPLYARWRKYPQYFKIIGTEIVDVYAIIDAFNVTSPGIQHAIKKLLAPGNRGHKSRAQDIKEAIDALSRQLELDK